jgi:hypothetical protein
MGRLSNRKKSRLENLRKARGIVELVSVENESLTTTDTQIIEIEETAIESVNSKLKDNSIGKRDAFSRGLMYSARHQRKLKQKNREMASGSAKISSYFSSVETVVMEEPPVESELEKLKTAYDMLSSELTPRASSSNILEKSNYERSKYQAVHVYLDLRIKGVKKMKASETAAKAFWYNKSTSYRSKIIRKYAKNYLESGKIAESAQGKHSKRVSVLDDNDIKRKVIEWFRSVPKFRRNIRGIQNELRTVILPSAIENNRLNLELDDSGAIINPLSVECIRQKLIQWGFSFKRVGKLHICL